MSIINNDIKKLIFTLSFVCIFLLGLAWIGGNWQSVYKFSNKAYNVLSGKKTYDDPYTNKLDKSKTYNLEVDTNLGNMIFLLDQSNEPNTVNNIFNLSKNDFYKNSTSFDKNEKYLLLGSGGDSSYTNVHYTIKEEINAQNLGLDKISVSQDFNTLKNIYDINILNQNLNKTVKNFYESVGYSYTSDIHSTAIKKGSLVMYSEDPGNFGNKFLISTADNMPEIDGRMTHFGDIQSGKNVLDMISQTDKSLIQINSIFVSEK